MAFNLINITIQIEGTLSFLPDIDQWPRTKDRKVLQCIYMKNISNVTFTSTGKGTLNGNGNTWWGFPGIGYLIREENRPKLLEIENSRNILVENLLFKNSPYWTFWVHNVSHLEVRFTDIDNRRTNADKHDIIDMTAFNTDGFDVTGEYVWIHDCNIWN